MKQFKQLLLQNGLSRINRFEVEIPLPDILLQETRQNEQTTNDSFTILKRFLGSAGEIVRGLSLMCQSTSLPALQIATTDSRKMGENTKMPYDMIYDTQSFTFLVSEDMYEKNIIDAWMGYVINRKNNKVRYYDEYITDITIHQLNKRDQRVKSIVLKEAYPVSIQAMEVANTTRNETHRLTVEFAYKKWFDAGDLRKSGETNYLEDTALFPFIADELSDPVTRAALDLLNNAGINVEGEAANVYDSIDSIIQTSSGRNTNQLINILNEIRGDTNTNDKISSDDRVTLINLIDSVLGSIGG